MSDPVIMTVRCGGKVVSELRESAMTAKGGIFATRPLLARSFWSEDPCMGCRQPLETSDPTARLCSACNWEANASLAKRIDPTFDTNVLWIAGFWPALAKLYGWEPDTHEERQADADRHYEAIREGMIILAKEEAKTRHNPKRR